MKTICFQSKQENESAVYRIDVKFQVVPTSCTSQLSFGVFIILLFIFINCHKCMSQQSICSTWLFALNKCI